MVVLMYGIMKKHPACGGFRQEQSCTIFKDNVLSAKFIVNSIRFPKINHKIISLCSREGEILLILSFIMKRFPVHLRSLVVLLWLLKPAFATASPAYTLKHHSMEDTFSTKACSKCIILVDQSLPAVDIIAAETEKLVWQWRPGPDVGIPAKDVHLFSNPDDAKPVYGGQYLLLNASGGGVALVRLADKQAVFYAYAGQNPHSSELLPDGNIVTASSNDNRLVLFHVDTTAEKVDKKIVPLPFAHNVVWDKKRQLLWSAARDKLYALRYNFQCSSPDLVPVDSIQLPGTDAHDLFPVFGKDLLWLTTVDGTYQVDPAHRTVRAVRWKYSRNIKSVSSGPEGFPVIVILPKEQWWTDEISDRDGHRIFRQPGMKIYKARWLLPNRFSYGDETMLKVCGK